MTKVARSSTYVDVVHMGGSRPLRKIVRSVELDWSGLGGVVADCEFPRAHQVLVIAYCLLFSLYFLIDTSRQSTSLLGYVQAWANVDLSTDPRLGLTVDRNGGPCIHG
jgi:hypothetical protein